jgi:hypothetical protein
VVDAAGIGEIGVDGQPTFGVLDAVVCIAPMWCDAAAGKHAAPIPYVQPSA